MAGKKSDLPGKKFSVWVSGDNQQRLAEQGLSPGEAIARGLEAHDRVPVPPEVREAMRYLSRLAEAAANGGQMFTVNGHGSVDLDEVRAKYGNREPVQAEAVPGEPPGSVVVPQRGDRPLTATEERAWHAERNGVYAGQEGWYRVPAEMAEAAATAIAHLPMAEGFDIPLALKYLAGWLHHGALPGAAGDGLCHEIRVSGECMLHRDHPGFHDWEGR